MGTGKEQNDPNKRWVLVDLDSASEKSTTNAYGVISYSNVIHWRLKMRHVEKMRSVCKQYAQKNKELNALKKEVDELKAYIALDTDQTTTDYGTWIAIYSDRNNAPKVDLKAIEKADPVLYKALQPYISTSVSKVLKVKGV